ncbi:MAG: hypothetical protein EG824_14760, partial [Deltaproteobacteria bacterium]|nr:hypothetical protein [Deltaproteobacteria bacterium]
MKTNTTRNATSNLGPLRLALLFTLLLITATPVTAAEIYVTTNTGTFGSPATLNRIYKYTVSGGVATPSIPSPLVTFSQASTTFLAVSGSQLFAARENVFPSFNDSIDVYNAITGASVKVPLVTGPKQRFRDVKVSGSHLFVAGSGSAIGEYNANTGALVNAVLAAVSFPQNMAVSPGPGGVVNLFVSSNNSGAATPGTGAIYKFTVSATGGVATPSTPSPLVSGLMFPTGIAVSPDGSKVFVLQDGPAPPPFSSDPTKSTISEYDANTGAPVKVPLVTGLNRPFDIAADESNLFVTLPVSGTIAEYDVNTGAPVKVPLVSGLSSPRGIEVEVSPLTASCDIFEEGTVSGFKGNNATLSFATPGPGGGSDHYLHTEDESGASYVVAPPRFNGNYTGLGTCSQICFDVQLFDDGDPNASVPRTPTLTLISG